MFFGATQHHHCSFLQVATSDNSDEDVQLPITITAYILVERPLPVVPACSRSSKINEQDKYVQRGPFKFLATDKYTSFLANIAVALPCPILNIIEDKITWKPRAPARSPLPLGGETGYSALVEYFAPKKTGHVVMIMMPPPMKPVIKKLFWKTGDNTTVPEQEFDYQDLEVRLTHDHVVEQQVSQSGFESILGY